MNKETWASHIGEELPCKRERGNPHDPFAVAVCKEANTVGHLPHTISSACYMFLGKSDSSISCIVTGPRRYSRDLPQGGLEIPCTLEFKGDKVSIDKVQWIIEKQGSV